MTTFDDDVDTGPPPAWMDEAPPWGGDPAPTARSGAADSYVLEDFDTLEPGDQAWCVKYLLPTVGLAILYGPSGGGKSFFVIDILRRICRGEPVLGRRSYPAGVIYLAAEGAQGVRKRIKGARDRYGALGGRFLLLSGQPNLTDKESVAVLTGEVLKGRAKLKKAGHDLRIVVVDTLAAASPGVDENTAASMGAVLGELQSLAFELGLLALVVTHTGKDESRGIRGWGGQFANADAVISLTEPNGEIRSGAVMKVKDGPSGDRFAFALEVVELGIDEDGDPITTCVCVEREAPPLASNRIQAVTKAGGTARLIMQAFGRVLEDNPQPVAAKGANGAKGVRETELREMSYKLGVGPDSAEIPDGADGKERARLLAAWRKQRGADYARGRDVLLSEHKLRAEDGIIWEIDAKKVIR